jgi:ectoine hydroxylase-related dioxygenase (phytanoyl-CoA dioxygenase family)
LTKRNLTWNEECNNHEAVRFKEVVVRCKGRMDVLFDQYLCHNEVPFWKNHAILNGIVNNLLYGGETDDLRPSLVYAGWIFSEAGSADQPFHQDGIPLFPMGNEQLPPYALNVFVPLQDTTVELGPTEFQLLSHHMPATTTIVDESTLVLPLPQRGDMLLYDYRVCHRGTANLTTNTLRSVLYLMYARPWFKEHVNFGTEPLLDETAATVRNNPLNEGTSVGEYATDNHVGCRRSR